MAPGFIIAAPASGSGKTLVTLALLRHFRNAGLALGSFKIGPDYIDPSFHAAAGGGPCATIDLWAMREELLAAQIARIAHKADLIIGEGVMGLFDGPKAGLGSTADVARHLGLPVVLVVDAGGMAASAAALVEGFHRHLPELPLSGVIFNRIGGPGHDDILRRALAGSDVALLGSIPRRAGLALPERHLGLVPAGEHGALDAFLDAAAAEIGPRIDTDALQRLARSSPLTASDDMTPPLAPLGQRIAVARDAAFAFAYDHVLDGWRRAGAQVMPFSPLAGAAPPGDADAVYLPGGYPELHAAALAGNRRFLDGLRTLAATGAAIYGECGGYMVLGEALADADGAVHAMAGLLPLQTSFAERRLHLTYCTLELAGAGALGGAGQRFRGHEFHYASVISEGPGDALFRARDAAGADLGAMGLQRGSVCGSYAHLIDRN